MACRSSRPRRSSCAFVGSDDNAAAFDQASLLTYARQPLPPSVREPTLLIAHGTADDNVYFLNSLKLADALEQGGRTFTLLPFIGQTHQFATAEAQEIVWKRAAATLRERLTR